MRILIIGGGIAGLCASIALDRIGVESLICERNPGTSASGAGISLWANALRALDRIGMGDDVRAVAQPCSLIELRQSGGRPLLRVDCARIERRRGDPPTLWMLHRADLLAALERNIPADRIRRGHVLTGVEQARGSATAFFADGSRESAEALIGADGIHSSVRESVFGAQPPRYTGQTCWRGVAEVPASLHPADHAVEIWGRGRRFGITPLPRGRVYWFAAADAPTGGEDANARGAVRDRFGAWAQPVPEVIEATPSAAIIRNDLIDRRPSRPWSNGRVLLIGDAAHSSTPNLGQGGCMAIEDAPVLARCLADADSLSDGFAAFEALRFKRTAKVTGASWRAGRQAHGRSWLARVARDSAVRLLPPPLAFRAFAAFARYDPGAVPAGSRPQEQHAAKTT